MSVSNHWVFIWPAKQKIKIFLLYLLLWSFYFLIVSEIFRSPAFSCFWKANLLFFSLKSMATLMLCDPNEIHPPFCCSNFFISDNFVQTIDANSRVFLLKSKNDGWTSSGPFGSFFNTQNSSTVENKIKKIFWTKTKFTSNSTTPSQNRILQPRIQLFF